MKAGKGEIVSIEVEFLYFLGLRFTADADEIIVGIVLLSSNILDLSFTRPERLFAGDATDDEQPGIR